MTANDLAHEQKLVDEYHARAAAFLVVELAEIGVALGYPEKRKLTLALLADFIEVHNACISGAVGSYILPTDAGELDKLL